MFIDDRKRMIRSRLRSKSRSVTCTRADRLITWYRLQSRDLLLNMTVLLPVICSHCLSAGTMRPVGKAGIVGSVG